MALDWKMFGWDVAQPKQAMDGNALQDSPMLIAFPNKKLRPKQIMAKNQKNSSVPILVNL